jgi:lysophospholipase L1-like esterase
MLLGRRAVLLLSALLCCAAAARAQLACGHFTEEALPAPAPRQAKWPVHRFEVINRLVTTEPHRLLFLGDSITERFEQEAPELWRQNMASRGVLDAGVSGDRTEHLLWRMQHGNLAGPMPKGAIVLIGTNDLTNGGNPRPPELIAEGIRRDLLYLRQRLPNTRILLLGLWPRSASPDARLRRGTVAVNRLIRACGDGRMVIYADIGGVLVEPDGTLSRKISPDLLHFSPAGYQRLIPRLDALIDELVPPR